MAKINGNDGGNNKNLMQGLQAYYEAIKAKAAGKTDKPNKTTGAEANIPVGKQANVEHKELGEDLLTANFYADMGLNLKANKKVEAGSLEDLAQITKTVDISKADKTDKLTAYNAVEGDDWSSYLVKAYMYGKLSESSMEFLNNSEQMKALNELAGIA